MLDWFCIGGVVGCWLLRFMSKLVADQLVFAERELRICKLFAFSRSDSWTKGLGYFITDLHYPLKCG